MSSLSLGKALERVELIRSSLRWAAKLDKTGIQKILHQLNQLRNDLLALSRQEKLRKGTTRTDQPESERTPSQRRQALQQSDFVFTGIFGENPDLLTVLETLYKAAASDFPVLIEGESGTGKELMARVVHSNSNRVDQPFVSVNCGAIPASLIESELFGHVKGAFTGADTSRVGRFEQADGGVLFLDELGELSLDNQVKLLRALQTGEIQRVGSDQLIRVDARVVAATNKQLFQMTRAGSFREDLYYRLSVITVTIPPLRERSDEIPLLVDYFLKEAAERLQRPPVELSPPLLKFLKGYAFPGNIRELQNIVYRLSCLAESVAGLHHLPDTIRPESRNPRTAAPSRNRAHPTLEEVKRLARDAAEEQFLHFHLQRSGGRVTELATELGLNRSYLQTLMKKHGLRSGDFKT